MSFILDPYIAMSLKVGWQIRKIATQHRCFNLPIYLFVERQSCLFKIKEFVKIFLRLNKLLTLIMVS